MIRASSTVFGLVAIGLVLMPGVAAAQFYPPGRAPQPYESRPLPPLGAGAEEPDPADRPGVRPERLQPYGQTHDPADGRRPIYVPDQGRQAAPNDPYGPARRPFFAPEQDSGAARVGTARRDDELLLRPPADISPSGPGAIMAPERAPAPTGSVRAPGEVGARRGPAVAALPPEDQPEEGPTKELPAQFKRQLVEHATKEPAGTIIIDTQNTFLYLVLGKGQALRYGIGVGREGFTWSGKERISKVAEWPDWHPPKEMIERQPYLPRMMAGGPGNPLGARALYLGRTIYRIHGTNQPSTIGQFVSSGCIRMLNEDVEDLYGRVQVGTRVVVLPGNPPASAAAPLTIAR